MNAIILAAGLGERMKPVTDRIPKPLLPVVNQRLIDININHLLRNGIKRIGINLYHKHELIREYLDQYQDQVFTVVEDELKGTGGALLNFRDFLTEDFLILSGDVLSDIRLTEIIDFHKTHDPIATLVLVKHKGTEFSFGKDNRITRISRGAEYAHTYSGIGVFSERVFSFMPQKSVFSIVDIFLNILETRELLMGLPSVMNWYNVNSLYAYWKVHHDLLNNQVDFESLCFKSPVYIASTSRVETEALKGFVSIGDDCIISKDVYLENTIVLPESRITSGNYRNCLLSDELRITVA
ncbi:hypothetical protein AMJ83_04785 [candidate division WOR_3 bacterium SM23_42]|uniref:Nucleotidyl transferase domain-containing protein n=1 Tax=candidate division WOR_3 bacterium SM23_42 TaxID=1703779 RepID=A0A0S8FUN3_UNCW3|nr:MAG: hypothetical protein AMJ83_04785 [candidate division WOR_3 bacterium SM23_42]